MHILGEMAKALTGARGDVRDRRAAHHHHHVPKDKIREVIGTGGKVIREIVEQTGAKIDIDDDGTIKIAAVDAESRRRRRSTGSAASSPSRRSA
jgi:polyribonucleotide nucleotidyltransferase